MNDHSQVLIRQILIFYNKNNFQIILIFFLVMKIDDTFSINTERLGALMCHPWLIISKGAITQIENILGRLPQ